MNEVIYTHFVRICQLSLYPSSSSLVMWPSRHTQFQASLSLAWQSLRSLHASFLFIRPSPYFEWREQHLVLSLFLFSFFRRKITATLLQLSPNDAIRIILPTRIRVTRSTTAYKRRWSLSRSRSPFLIGIWLRSRTSIPSPKSWPFCSIRAWTPSISLGCSFVHVWTARTSLLVLFSLRPLPRSINTPRVWQRLQQSKWNNSLSQ